MVCLFAADLAILVILNNMKHNVVIEKSVTLMKMLMSLVALNEVQAQGVITESVRVLERNEKQRLAVTGYRFMYSNYKYKTSKINIQDCSSTKFVECANVVYSSALIF